MDDETMMKLRKRLEELQARARSTNWDAIRQAMYQARNSTDIEARHSEMDDLLLVTLLKLDTSGTTSIVWLYISTPRWYA